jgi:mercuric reductase
MIHLKITGMTCDSCAEHVKEALERVPGVQSALVSYPKGTAQLAIEAGTSPDALTAAVAGLGYKASLADTPPANSRAASKSSIPRASGTRRFPASGRRCGWNPCRWRGGSRNFG